MQGERIVLAELLLALRHGAVSTSSAADAPWDFRPSHRAFHLLTST
jgi:hypothetical protein